MIASINGIVLAKEPGTLIVEAGGVGYEILCTQATFERAPELGMQYRVATRLIVREDSQTLYGFSSNGEREFFDMVLAVSGIGPKTGLAIVSSLGATKIREAIIQKDLATLTALPGIGKKTAERIIVELRDKLLKEETYSSLVDTDGGGSDVRAQALAALVALGYTRQSAEKAIREVIKTEPDQANAIDRLIKAALRQAS
jgi:holliday junction DNA helicase RuvA